MSQLQAFGNVLPSSTTQSTKAIENEENERLSLARMALRILAGVKEPEKANLMSLYKMVEFLDVEDVKSIMRLGCDTYSDSFNKYPKPYFWKQIKKEVMRKKIAFAPEKIIPKDRPSEEERFAVQKKAAELAEMFAPKKKESEEANLYSKKFQRYKKYIDDDLVRIEDPESVAFQNWVPRKKAVDAGLCFHDPAKWVQKRELMLGKL